LIELTLDILVLFSPATTGGLKQALVVSDRREFVAGCLMMMELGHQFLNIMKREIGGLDDEDLFVVWR
jgi:hypothetical protein